MIDKNIVQIIIVVLFILLIVVFIVLFILIYHRRQVKNLQEKQLLQSQHAQALLQTQLEIQEQTLNTIAQEIHDNIGQTLGVVKIDLNNMLLKEPNKRLEATKDQLTKAINDLRALTRSLHSGRIADLGLAEALKQELQTLQNTGQFTTQLQTTGKAYRLPAQHEMVLFRMAQEALHNAIKHSGAAHIAVALDYLPEQFTLTITDSGKGFDPAALATAQKGVGLRSLHNRAELIGAQLSINAAEGEGTTVVLTLPQQPSTVI
jgi:two-component system, NarL family, sensor kinase